MNLRQTINLIREDKVFTTVYTAGTALAVGSAMIVVIIVHLLLSNIGAEVNRDRTGYIHLGMGNNFFTPTFIDEIIPELECADATVAQTSRHQCFIKSEQNEYRSLRQWRGVNADYFKMYEYDFIEGGPITEEQVKNGEACMVISEDVAEYLFGTTQDVVGKTAEIADALDTDKMHTARVVGLIKNPQAILTETFNDVITPYTFLREIRSLDTELPYIGDYRGLQTRLLLRDGYTCNMAAEEINEKIDHYLTMRGIAEDDDQQVMSRRHVWVGSQVNHSFSIGNGIEAEEMEMAIYLLMGIIATLLMLLPAINLSGLVSNRMEERLPELGIRKTFGANKISLLGQVITENLILTSLGGIVGYIVATIFCTAMTQSKIAIAIFSKGSAFYYTDGGPDLSYLSFDMLFTPGLFVITFICCTVLNLMVALIPAIRALRKPIIYSLNQKK